MEDVKTLERDHKVHPEDQDQFKHTFNISLQKYLIHLMICLFYMYISSVTKLLNVNVFYDCICHIAAFYSTSTVMHVKANNHLIRIMVHGLTVIFKTKQSGCQSNTLPPLCLVYVVLNVLQAVEVCEQCQEENHPQKL